MTLTQAIDAETAAKVALDAVSNKILFGASEPDAALMTAHKQGVDAYYAAKNLVNAMLALGTASK